MTVLRKKFLFSYHLHNEKKKKKKEDPRRKKIHTLIFPKLPSAYDVVAISNLCEAYHKTLFTPKEAKVGR